jgi:hypothetical protein
MDETRPIGSVRRPGAVPDDVVGGFDTDGDGLPDTLLTADGVDLLVQSDLDVDGLVDRVLRIGPDGVVRAEPPSVEVDDPVAGSVRAQWPGLLGAIFGTDP